ncbi:MAG: acetylornithine deacetylase [Rhizobiaceae bacterium]
MNPSILDTLARLIAFPTISRRPNLELLDYVEGLLKPAGVRVERFAYDDGSRANLWASVGPQGDGGVVLSGHSDVVPVEGQAWSRDPFVMHREAGLLYGRGATDMKGFVAVAIHAMLRAAEAPLKRPLHLALSCDEEIGCLGVRPLVDALAGRAERPDFCLIGEPTSMRIASGHKGKLALRACCHGREGHSALAPNALNALHLGASFIRCLQERQEEIEARGLRDDAYDIPYTTLHAGVMQGGTALNIVPNQCTVDFEIRHIAADDPEPLIAALEQDAEAIALPFRNRFPDARIEIERLFGYPGLETPEASEAIVLMRRLLGTAEPAIKVAYGTEGGLFQQALGVPVVVCGPGDMAQGHKPDEFVSEEQLARCDTLMAALVMELSA